MVAHTSAGNFGNCFVEHPRQTSMQHHYAPWRGHDPAQRKPPNTELADAQKKKDAIPVDCA